MICFIEAMTFEDDAGWEQDAANRAATFGTGGQWLIGHFLPRLEAVTTGLTEILVGWHYQSPLDIHVGHNHSQPYTSAIMR